MGVFFTGKELINVAVGIERNGLAFYQSLVSTEKNTTVKNTYEYLANMEEYHIEKFQGMLNTVGEDAYPDFYTEEYDLYLKALVDSSVFTDDKTARELAENARNSSEAIQIALGAEKDSILFYTGMRDVIRQRDRETIDQIIEEEKSHLRQLTDVKKGLSGQ